MYHSLKERERQLRNELLQCRHEGISVFLERQKKLQNLIKESGTVKKENWFNELNSFYNEKKDDQKLAYMTRYVYDNSNIINSVSNFGQGIFFFVNF